jgi:hypothetical protein
MPNVANPLLFGAYPFSMPSNGTFDYNFIGDAFTLRSFQLYGRLAICSDNYISQFESINDISIKQSYRFILAMWPNSERASNIPNIQYSFRGENVFEFFNNTAPLPNEDATVANYGISKISPYKRGLGSRMRILKDKVYTVSNKNPAICFKWKQKWTRKIIKRYEIQNPDLQPPTITVYSPQLVIAMYPVSTSNPENEPEGELNVAISACDLRLMLIWRLTFIDP